MRKTIEVENLSTIANSIRNACKKYPKSAALTCMGQDMTFSELDRQSSALAVYFERDLNLKKRDRIAIMVPNIMQFPIAFIAAQKLGLVCVNTNPLYTPREMKHQLQDSGAKAIVIIDLFMDKLEQIITGTQIKAIVVASLGDYLPPWKRKLIQSALRIKGMIPKHNLSVSSFMAATRPYLGQEPSPVALSPDDIALLQYTGGTTGTAKGAMLTQRNILSNMEQIRNCAINEFEEGREVVLTALPLYHIFALTVNFLTFLSMGSRMLLVPKPVPIKNTVKIFKKYPITVMTGVNTLFNALSHDESFRKKPPKHLKFALAGGMALQDAVNHKWQQIVNNTIVQGFGLTEAAPVTHVNPLDGGMPGSIGLPVASTDARIVDDEGRDVPNGTPGELIVKGPQVMTGYWNRPEETQSTLKDGWLYTGDIATRDDAGYFYIVDRKKDMINVSGFNVFPNEIEDVLVQHEKVIEAAVIGVPDSKAGEAVKAFVVAKDDSLCQEDILAYCREHLTAYKRPKHVEFRSELPKTNVGKILRKELRSENRP